MLWDAEGGNEIILLCVRLHLGDSGGEEAAEVVAAALAVDVTAEEAYASPEDHLKFVALLN